MKVISVSALLVFSAALLGMAVAVAPGELAPYLATSQSEPTRFDTLGDGQGQTGVSGIARQGFLTACDVTAVGTYAQLQPTDARMDLMTRCRAAAETIVAKAPLYGPAWTTIAELSGLMGDTEAFRAALAQSHRTASNLYAYATRRLVAATAHPEMMDAATSALIDADTRALLTSYIGTNSVARRYAALPAERQHITSVVLSAPADQQQRFIERVNAIPADQLR